MTYRSRSLIDRGPWCWPSHWSQIRFKCGQPQISCWSNRRDCHPERSEGSQIFVRYPQIRWSEMFRFAQH